jgi:hypothetical protein
MGMSDHPSWRVPDASNRFNLRKAPTMSDHEQAITDAMRALSEGLLVIEQQAHLIDVLEKENERLRARLAKTLETIRRHETGEL